MLVMVMPLSELAIAGGGDMGGGGTWKPLEGSVPCLCCPYILKLPVGVELGVELEVCGRAGGGGGETGGGLVVRDLGGGGGGGSGGSGELRLELELGMDGSGLADCRTWVGVIPSTREALVDSVGEWPVGETGDSDPLAVFALRRDPADEGAERR